MITTKNLFCLVWIIMFGFISFNGQAQDTMSLEQKVQNVLSGLDQSEISTGIFYERAPEYVALDMFDGRELPDSTLLEGNQFEMAYGMIYTAYYDNSLLMPMNNFLATANRMKDSSKTVFSSLYFQYDRFKENVIEDDLIIVDTIAKTISRGTNTGTSPYIIDTLFAINSFNTIRHSLHQEFVFDESLFFTNMPLGFTGVEIDFGDGLGYRAVVFGQDQSIDFPGYGKYIIKLKVLDNTGKELHAHTYINITPQLANNYSNPDIIYDEEVEIWHFKNTQCGDTGIYKPLILLEGLDYGEGDNETVDEEYINDLLSQDITIDNNTVTLGDILYPEGYDILFINNKNSTGDIFATAAAVSEAIQWINEQKALNGSDEENVVIGFSMGGLVGKAALRNMELAGIDHETKFYMTFDSPMKGANYPLGIQCMINHVNNLKILGVKLQDWLFVGSSLKNFKEMIDAPASKQMLYYHFSSSNWNEPGSTDDIHIADANDLDDKHDSFYHSFENLGNLNIPEIAISNGAIIAGIMEDVDQGFGPGDKLLDFFLPLYGRHTILLKLKVNALPDGSGQIYYGKLDYYFFGINLSSQKDVRKIKNALPYDSAPGGSRSLPSFEVENIVEFFPWEHLTHCYIPTISALGIDDIDQEMYPYYIEDLTNPDNVLPFSFYSDYIGSTDIKYTNNLNINEEHIYINGESTGKFLISYLVPQNPLLEDLGNPADLYDKTYNFGATEIQAGNTAGTSRFWLDNTIDFDLDVYDNGKLWYNRNDLLAFINESSNPPNDSPQSYKGIIKGAECGEVPTLVEIYNGGEMIIGDQSVNNTATVEIRDNGTLEVGVNGLIKLEDQSEILVKEAGTLNVECGGVLNSTFGSSIRIESGGKLHVKSGGILRIQHYSDLIVEDGGQLIIDAGAKIQLWDGQDPDGAANIHVKGGGELVWRGKPDFSGNGYFQFDKDNILTLQSDFELEGIGQNSRLIQLNAEAKLLVEDKNLKLSEGKIVYYGTALIESKSNMIIVNNVDFYSYDIPDSWNLATAIWGNKAKSTQIDNSNFHDFFSGLIIDGESNTNLYNDNITNSNFFNTNTAISISKRLNTMINDCTFNECGVGVYETNNDNLVLGESTMTDVTTGVWLNNINLFKMQGGSINFLLTGILAIDGSNNISLIDGATIKNQSWYPPVSNDNTDVFAAVALNGTVSGPALHPIIHGTLYMDCATLSAYNGVKGSNIVFEIDAMENSGGEHPNSFICHYAFDVCYYNELSDIVGTINAKGNYWEFGPNEADQNPPPSWDVANIYSFKDIPWGSDCGHPISNDHTLDFSDAVTDPPTNCSRGGDREENDYYNFASNTDTQLTENTNIINNKNDIIIYPNPVSDVFTIVFDDNSQYDMTLFNIFGQIVLNKPVFNGTKINTENLKSGIYLYQFENKNKQIITGKLIIDKNN